MGPIPLFAVSLLFGGWSPAANAAATIAVTTTADEAGGNPAACSLREAITAANTDAAFGGCPAGSGTDLITAPAGTTTLAGAAGDDANASGDLDVGSPMTIQGAGRDQTIIQAGTLGHPSGNGVDRVLHVVDGSELTLTGLTIRNGKTPDNGAGILSGTGALTLADVAVVANSSDAGNAGGLSNDGVLSLTDVLVSGNHAAFIAGVQGRSNMVSASIIDTVISNNTADSSLGGAHFDSGNVAFTRSVIEGNISSAGGGISANSTQLSLDSVLIHDNQASGNGGGLYLTGSTTFTMTASTVSENRADEGDGLYSTATNAQDAIVANSTFSGNGAAFTGDGGAIRAGPDLDIALRNVTFDQNLAFDGANVFNAGAVVSLRNTIVGDDSGGGNCGGTTAVTDLGNNIEEGAAASPCLTSGFVADVGIEPLADNGGAQLPEGLGTAPTHALTAASPALEQGAGCEPTDQRGVPRPQGAGCDIGAYEQAFCQGFLVNRVGVPSGQGTVSGTSGSDGILGLGGDEIIDAMAGDDKVCAGSGNDMVTGASGNDSVLAEGGDDSAAGGPGNDAIVGGAGSDGLSGESGEDTLEGGEGDDTIEGGDENDRLSGEEGNDALLGDSGDDVLDGGAGDDQLDGGAGDDQLDGGTGNDGINGEDGNDIAAGGAGNDGINGEDGNDIAAGGAGNDRLRGGKGKDRLKGQAGRDRMNGGKQRDRCVGGGGKKDRASRSCEKVRGVP